MDAVFSAVSNMAGSVNDLLLSGMTILLLTLGWISLFMGRRFFWVFVGLVGFLLGVLLTRSLALPLPAWAQPLAPIALGLLFALLAVRFQRPMAIVAGFFIVGALVASWTGRVVLPDWARTTAIIAAGVVGALAVFKAFDWAVVLFSAIIGAALLTLGLQRVLPLDRNAGFLATALLAAAGIIFQLRDERAARRSTAGEQSQVTLDVTNVQRSVDFYVKTLGFDFGGYWEPQARQIVSVWRLPEPPAYAEVTRGPQRVGLRLVGEGGAAEAELALRVSDLDDLYGRVQYYTRSVAEPVEQPRGGRTFTVTDPDGYRWHVVESGPPAVDAAA